MKFKAPGDLSLLEALVLLSPGSSKTTLKSWLQDSRVTVDGCIVKHANFLVHQGQEVALGARLHFIKDNIRILYEDKAIGVVAKPEGLLSVATAFEKSDTTHALLKEHYKPRRVFVVHRLDQETSGIMLFAFTEEARDRLKEIFEKHDIERLYYGIVEGKMESGSGTWQSYLYEDENYYVHSTQNPKLGQLAITHYEVLTSTKKYTLLRLTLETGKKNQIRVHCQDAGHPIVGDKKYGAATNPIKRLCLHAYHLAFSHPLTNQKMRFEVPMPESFNRIISR